MLAWRIPGSPDDDEALWRRRTQRFASGDDEHSRRLWCLMLTLMIMCGSAVLVAVLVAAMIFMAQNRG